MLRWWGTVLYVPGLYITGFLLSRPLAWVAPAWRPDQVDLAGVSLSFALLLATLPWRLRTAWGATQPWRTLGLAVSPGQALAGIAMGLTKAIALLLLVSLALLFSQQARWQGATDAGLLANALLLACGVGLAEELLFRGWLWGELRLRLNGHRALLAQALVFGLVHPWYREPGLLALSLLGALTLLGVVLARERELGKGALWGPAALHGGLVGGWFLLQNGLLTVSAQAPGWWAGPSGMTSGTNPLGGAIGWLGLLGLLLYQQRRGHSLGR
ncbi:CPBP family intramembrane glutamic endopeptidase [Cyanobium sp. LEGE 06113]|uniref:CPBP family intramembrane glutamic endopeptidase n=1 Tax=Cyanobium sp. LEGE 06113 TaxID=1297573 RepID=UPI00187F2E90|nr:type II CAAX endopeptidase family protein [Cyanobium sp. LEGE 06113]MBE9155225.1 CPBP family intramembrane metalloprotease [Cyanobium sp. LEGE 06113]